MSRTEKKKKNQSKKKWWILTPLIIILVLFLFVGGYAWYVLNGIRNTMDHEMHESVTSIDTSLTQKKINNRENINVLLLGIDSESSESGRSDAVMVMSLQPNKEQAKLISIPRDTRTEIVGKGTVEKVNHAFAYGGADMAINTVEHFLGVEMDYFVRINMDGLSELVDEVGPITVNNDMEWQDGPYHFTKGPLDMDGDKTMSYVRMRKHDPQGDFGRTERQRKVIEAIIKESATISNVTRIGEITTILGNNMGTNIESSDTMRLFTNYTKSFNNFESYQIQGTGTTIDGVYYYIVDDAEVEKVREMISN